MEFITPANAESTGIQPAWLERRARNSLDGSYFPRDSNTILLDPSLETDEKCDGIDEETDEEQ